MLNDLYSAQAVIFDPTAVNNSKRSYAHPIYRLTSNMAFQTHVTYYNEAEIDAIYTERVSPNIEIEKTRTTTVTSRILAILGIARGEVRRDSTEKRLEHIANENTMKAVEVTRNLINSADGIPELNNIPSSGSEYYRYSGKVDIYLENGYEMARIEGADDDFQFVAYASGDNWTSKSYLARAGSGNPQGMNIDGIAYPLSRNQNSRDQYEIKFIVIYPGSPMFAS